MGYIIKTIIKEGGIYKHNKSGAVYITLKCALDEDKRAVIIYFELNKPTPLYTCKIDNFMRRFRHIGEVKHECGN